MRDNWIAYVIEEPSGHVRAHVRGRTWREAEAAAEDRAARYKRACPTAELRITIGHVGNVAEW